MKPFIVLVLAVLMIALPARASEQALRDLQAMSDMTDAELQEMADDLGMTLEELGVMAKEQIAWCAVAGAGISGSDVRDMMLEAVEKRFGDCRAPELVELLSDNGSPYRARDTRIFAAQLGLKPCFTPVASPESNGVAEAFVKTMKRDYVRINPLPDAATALKQIDGWFEDYNDNHPHSALRMRSPREFIRAKSQTA